MTERESDDEGARTDSKGRHAPLREDEVERALDTIVSRGRPRLFRTMPELLASGTIAGIEISLGVLAFLSVEQATGSKPLAGLAFGVGFIALLLGNSELFTEGFLVPIAVVLAREAGWWRLARFWLATLVGNLLGGWLSMWMVVVAFPGLREVAIETGGTFAESGFTPRTFLLAVLAGSTMTLLTRMRIGTGDDVARVLASMATAFLVAGLGMYHSVLDTLFIFGGIHAGAGYGYGSWIAFFGWTVLGNAVGGIGLTTFLRLVRSHERLYEWRRSAPASRRP
ncbi:Formate/nitrite transporter FocA, FNT family [Actinopolyspora xinjiangensis]|uniref:Formate/nitrite transporter FocA, FNT family n=1 Tax=Actinopolyspora xinjiangensis TaxID=405564 RepID=A0A1H0NSR6_9ACTN|nr:formate/nitrite transporter family protein [Actinopolyspora xinjiangensis]SDO95450.1 Formate/nitrite transporter FocA, FNT family [Actinopolyspora xinjiangensis]